MENEKNTPTIEFFVQKFNKELQEHGFNQLLKLTISDYDGSRYAYEHPAYITNSVIKGGLF